MKLNIKKNYLKEKGITLIALVITIAVMLILAGVSISALFGDSGIIDRAKEAQNETNQATERDKKEIKELSNWLDSKINKTTGRNTTEENTAGGNTTGEDDTPPAIPKISALVGTVVDKNTKAEDAYGNKITIPKGFKILEHNPTSSTGAVTYNYTNPEETGEHIPAVQDGIVIENGADGNQFVWVPVGTIKNKDNTTTTITLGRYSDFTITNGIVASGQPVQVASVENCTKVVAISNYYQELSTFREGNLATDSTAQNATARNLKEFISTTLANGGYYIARFEASKNTTTNKVESRYNKTVLTDITQPNAATLARAMYGDTTDYASDLVNSYAWDTAIIFIQTYSTEIDASTYASKNKSTTYANTGINTDKYCNIWDMSGNASEYTTEYATHYNFSPCTFRGGCYAEGTVGTMYTTAYRNSVKTTFTTGDFGLRPLLYVK